ncbi:hypothetical protein ASE78_00235 [Sphingomonas sp. Leaf25]|nr:hypothetical protein ASE78_00235 [Sphingomonas sp. Leaf25]
MVEQVTRRPAAHRVEHDIDAFPPGQFRRRHEIGITGDKDDLIDLPFEGHCRDIESESHVDALLDGLYLEILVAGDELFVQPAAHRFGFGNPDHVVVQPSQTQRYLARVEQPAVDRLPLQRGRRFGQV